MEYLLGVLTATLMSRLVNNNLFVFILSLIIAIYLFKFKYNKREIKKRGEKLMKNKQKLSISTGQNKRKNTIKNPIVLLLAMISTIGIIAGGGTFLATISLREM